MSEQTAKTETDGTKPKIGERLGSAMGGVAASAGRIQSEKPWTTIGVVMSIAMLLTPIIRGQFLSLPNLLVLWQVGGFGELLLGIGLYALIVCLAGYWAFGVMYADSGRTVTQSLAQIAHDRLGPRGAVLLSVVLCLVGFGFNRWLAWAVPRDLELLRYLSVLGRYILLLGGAGLLVWVIRRLTGGRRDRARSLALGKALTVSCRALDLAMASIIVGSLGWLLVALPGTPFTWRLFTLWAVMHLGLNLVLLGRLVDVWGPPLALALGWHSHRSQTARHLIGSVLALSLWATNDLLVPVGQTDDAAMDWFTAVNERLAEMDAASGQGPVILVAAAGGGSRAALYAIQVLDALDRDLLDPAAASPDAAHLSDRVLMISGVSGGSVATAHYAFSPQCGHGARLPKDDDCDIEVACDPDCATRNTLSAELAYFYAEEAQVLTESESKSESWWGTKLPDEDTVTQAQALLEPGSDPLSSMRFNALSADFTAAMLRGSVAPGVERGESMSHFWNRQLAWRADASESELLGRSRRAHTPLLLINTTSVRTGLRIVAGFPRLPRGLMAGSGDTGAFALADLDSPVLHGGAAAVIGAKEAELSDDEAPSKGDKASHVASELVPSDGYALSISEAVRVSANFPWSFNLPTLRADWVTGGSKEDILANDGGVLDNSGIDTFAVMIDQLQRRSQSADGQELPCDANPAASLLCELRRRGVVLLEIDSGAKPEDPGFVQEHAPNIFLPIQSLSMAGYVRSRDAVGEHIRDLTRVLGEDRVEHVEFSLDTEQLVTAWGLTPQQKARLLARFGTSWTEDRQALDDAFAALTHLEDLSHGSAADELADPDVVIGGP